MLCAAGIPSVTGSESVNFHSSQLPMIGDTGYKSSMLRMAMANQAQGSGPGQDVKLVLRAGEVSVSCRCTCTWVGCCSEP